MKIIELDRDSRSVNTFGYKLKFKPIFIRQK